MSRITNDADEMGGKPCIRGLRVTVGGWRHFQTCLF
ncbi:MAG: DUF433 domain-containing protein [Phycisphaerales bacterium]|nr:DUF433 domain-containing protein [Phycisphaerales bacterium]